MALLGIGIRLGTPTGDPHGVGLGLLRGTGVGDHRGPGGRHGAGAGGPHGVGLHPDGVGPEMSARTIHVIQVRSVIRAVYPDPVPTADIAPLQAAILIIAVTVPPATTDPRVITVPDHHHRATEATARQTPLLSSTTTIPTTTPIVAPDEIRQVQALSEAGARQEAATAEALRALQAEEVAADVTDSSSTILS